MEQTSASSPMARPPMRFKKPWMTLSKQGYKIDHLRMRSLPVAPEVKDFVHAHERNYVIELNRDGQLHQILQSGNSRLQL